MGTQLPSPKWGTPPIFGPFLLWPNGCMDQDATWYGGRPQPRRPCVRWGPSSPYPKGAQPLIFGQCPLWPNGWMDEDATWYGTRSRSRPHCDSRGPSSPQRKGHISPPLFIPCLLWPRSPILLRYSIQLAITSSQCIIVVSSFDLLTS